MFTRQKKSNCWTSVVLSFQENSASVIIWKSWACWAEVRSNAKSESASSCCLLDPISVIKRFEALLSLWAHKIAIRKPVHCSRGLSSCWLVSLWEWKSPDDVEEMKVVFHRPFSAAAGSSPLKKMPNLMSGNKKKSFFRLLYDTRACVCECE